MSLGDFAVEGGDERLDFLDEVGHEVDVPGVLLEVVGDEVKIHAPRRYAGFVMEL